jgi:hypothetical protein
MKMSKWRGHEIVFEKDSWRYSDTKKTVESYANRECGHCGNDPTKESHDDCLKTLPGVMNACCGHGDIETCYVQFLDGRVISGKRADSIIKVLKGKGIK